MVIDDSKQAKVAPVTPCDFADAALERKVITDICPLGEEYQGYWDLLSAEEKTLKFDIEGLYSYTVRDLALGIADRLEGQTILDPFCGVGGNAMAFAMKGKSVIAYDNSMNRLELAKENAQICGVADAIEFRLGDAVEAILSVKADAVFLDPPWGGPQYAEMQVFPFEGFNPDGRKLLEMAISNFRNVAFKLPLNFDTEVLKNFDGFLIVEPDLLRARPLHKTAYFQSK